MIGFWIVAALTLLAAYALLIPALLGKRSRSKVDRQRLNLMLHQQRQDELAGEFSGKELEGLQLELDKDLLGDLATSENVDKPSAGQGYIPLIATLIVAPFLGILVYAMLGRFDLADFRAQPEAHQQANAAPEIQGMIDRLAKRLKENPNDMKGWLLLGRSYQQTEQFDQAVEAYAQALKLEPESIDIKALYAESLANSLGGNYTGETAQIAAEILAKNPKHHTALWLASAGAEQNGEPAKAIAFLETLRGEFAKDSPEEQHLTKIISQIKGGGQTEQADSNAAENAAASDMPTTGEQKSIRVKVTLAPSLKAKASPDDTVFIFARAAAGPPMPLAIVKKRAKDLPTEVTLDDSMSMVQGMNLSAFDKLVIGARVSKAGQALPQPGDLQGLTKPLEIENGGSYAVEIGEEVK
ncbi:MAG: c-type cytochrome biogenesis protein CcmI [Candidatus Methylumidiphilus alinenensis]|uniref:C-type cytochrome biogenesis protein CcmI n=1 Tax=Candidatus Methylumidiphilus alinenensis TaxID=2202197 RepID=A0A2W4QYL7_9GAMM|nr:MAG: c-type cytochrome biogenesis protein CcmI [Candidatus Methylumidiphilus alinenensis]